MEVKGLTADEIETLKGIALSELNHGVHGSFLTSFLDAFLRADSENAQILAPAMRTLVQKYGLKNLDKEA